MRRAVIAFGFTFATINAESAEITDYLTALKLKVLQIINTRLVFMQSAQKHEREMYYQ